MSNGTRSKSTSDNDGPFLAVNTKLVSTTKSAVTPSKISNEKIFEMFSKIDGNQTILEKKFDALETNIEQQLSAWKIEMDKTLVRHTSDIDGKINDMAENFDFRIGSLEYNHEQFERNTRLNDVVVRGVPQLTNEKIYEIFKNLAWAIKFQYVDVRLVLNSIFRLSKDGPILIKFNTLAFKNDFMKKYFIKKNLSASDIGFQKITKRIYMNDNLTKHNEEIHKLAYKLKKDDVISQLNIRDGLVFIKVDNQSQKVKIADIDQLKELVSGLTSNKPGTSNEPPE